MPTASTRAVAITGLGAVTALGADVRALVTGLAEGRCAIGPLTLFAHAGRCRIAAEVPEAVPVPLAAVAPATARRLSRADRFALAAAAEACRDAGLDAALRQQTAIALGATTGGMRETEEAYRRRRAGEDRRFRLGRMLGTPLSTSAAAVSQALGLFGPRVTFSTACSSSALAIAAATDAIRAGRTRLALAIGTDQLCRLTYAGFDALQALDPEPCRPFDGQRRGLSLGEGAAALVLEEAVHAHGSGTPQNDAVEVGVLRAVFGRRLPRVPVSSTKSQLGHTLGAAGAVEAVVTVRALGDGLLPPTVNLRAPDPAWADLDLVREPGRRVPLAVAVTSSYGFGGHNVTLVLGRAGAV